MTCDVSLVAMFMLNIHRYNWKKFAVVTSAIAGHDDFVQVSLLVGWLVGRMICSIWYFWLF